MRRIPISVSAAVLLIGTLRAQQASQNPAELAQYATELQQAGKYAEAADAYTSLLKLAPDDVATHVNLGVVLAKLGRYDEAIREYQAADKLLPNDPRIGLNMALAYQKSGHFQEAQQRFEGLHAADPQNAQVTMLVADSHLQRGDNEAVVQLLQPIKNSEDLGVAYMLGIALLRMHRVGEAQTYLDRILRNGDTAEARFLLGTRIFESGDYPAAAKQLASAAELNPNLPEVESLYGRALLNTGDPDGAITAFQKELITNPTDFDANLALAQIYVARKAYLQAEPLVERALQGRPDSADAKLVSAECLLARGEYPQARRLAEEAVRDIPKSIDAHRTLAAIYGALHLNASRDREENAADFLIAENDPGPKVNEAAPDFELADANTGKKLRLSEFRGKSPVALIFGSYSCPNFRGSADALKAMQQRYGSRIPFLLVYIREAHATNQWTTARNVREDISLSPATTMAEKEDHATMCSRKLHLPFPALVDSMDGAVESTYNAWPSRVYIIGRDGRILYSSRLTELDFEPDRMDAILLGLAGRATVSFKSR